VSSTRRFEPEDEILKPLNPNLTLNVSAFELSSGRFQWQFPFLGLMKHVIPSAGHTPTDDPARETSSSHGLRKFHAVSSVVQTRAALLNFKSFL
jgi:hypothetical protein